MIEIIVAPRSSGVFDPRLLDSMFRLRKRVFVDRLGWPIPHQGDCEEDIYDTLDPVYLIAYETSCPYHAIGCWRMLPTRGPHMLADVFPALLGGADPAPGAAILEISRFATDGDHASKVSGFGPLAIGMLRAMWCHASHHGAHGIVGVTNPAMLRLLTLRGFLVVRLCAPHCIGTTPCIAFHLPLLPAVTDAVFCGASPPDAGSTWRAQVSGRKELPGSLVRIA